MKINFLTVLSFILIVCMISGCTDNPLSESNAQQSSSGASSTSSEPDQTSTPSDDGRNMIAAKDGTMFYETGLPIVDPSSDVTLTIMTETSAADPSMFPLIQQYEEETGIKFEWNTYSLSSLELLDVMWASGDYPDIVLINRRPEHVDTYGPQGSIIPLNDYIDKYLTTFKENCDSETWDKTWNKLTYPDGNIYVYPTVALDFYCNNSVPTINREWLEKLSLDVPTTPDEFVEVLRAFKTQDPNGNGIADEIPLVTQNINEQGVFEAYALAGWTGALTGFQYVEDGEIVYPLIGEETKEAAKWLNQLWNEGLIDIENFSQEESTALAKAQGDETIYGAAVVWREGNFFGEDRGTKSYYPMEPLAGEDGSKMWYGTHDNTLVMNQWCVTSSCEVPEIVARFVDYLYTPEISIQSYWGPFGTGLEQQDDGTWKRVTPEGFTSIAEWFEDNHIQQVPRLAIGSYEALEYKDSLQYNFKDGYYTENQTGAIQKNIHDNVLRDYLVNCHKSMNIKPTPEETETYQEYYADLYKYVQEALTRFVVGQLDIDEEWDNYCDQVNNLGYNELLEMYNAQYDRFTSSN